MADGPARDGDGKKVRDFSGEAPPRDPLSRRVDGRSVGDGPLARIPCRQPRAGQGAQPRPPDRHAMQKEPNGSSSRSC